MKQDFVATSEALQTTVTTSAPASQDKVSPSNNWIKVPDPIVVKSEPIETITEGEPSTTSTSVIANTTMKQSEAEPLKGPQLAMFNNVPYAIVNPIQMKPHLFDNAVNQDSQKELINFIQNLMNQAKKEQEMSSTTTEGQIPSLASVTEYVDKTTPTPTSTSIAPRITASTTTASAPTLPFRTTLRTSAQTTTVSTTTDGSPSGVITKLLSEAAAPIAGLSAATLAYSAAAMLPVWLPAALAGKRKKRSTDTLENIYDVDIIDAVLSKYR